MTTIEKTPNIVATFIFIAMMYFVIIFGVTTFFVGLHLKTLNDTAIQRVKQDIKSIQEKQIKISDKVLLNNSYDVDLKIEVNQLSNEVITLHKEFITKYAR